MPIKPENRAAYSRKAGWPEARLRILKRAGGKCETCGAKNHATGYRDGNGAFLELHGDGECAEAKADGHKVIRIVLTIAHVDQDGHTGKHDDARLLALCQRCHLRMDSATSIAAASRTRALKRTHPDQLTLFPEVP